MELVRLAIVSAGPVGLELGRERVGHRVALAVAGVLDQLLLGLLEALRLAAAGLARRALRRVELVARALASDAPRLGARQPLLGPHALLVVGDPAFVLHGGGLPVHGLSYPCALDAAVGSGRRRQCGAKRPRRKDTANTSSAVRPATRAAATR